MSYISSLDAGLLPKAAPASPKAPHLTGLLGMDNVTTTLPADAMQIGLFVAVLGFVSVLLTLVISSAF